MASLNDRFYRIANDMGSFKNKNSEPEPASFEDARENGDNLNAVSNQTRSQPDSSGAIPLY
jgi:hypothetical protein